MKAFMLFFLLCFYLNIDVLNTDAIYKILRFNSRAKNFRNSYVNKNQEGILSIRGKRKTSIIPQSSMKLLLKYLPLCLIKLISA